MVELATHLGLVQTLGVQVRLPVHLESKQKLDK